MLGYISANMSQEERIVNPRLQTEDLGLEAGLRPRDLTEFVGQEELRRNLEIALEAARARGEAVDHILVHGPPGLGKTTLAYIIAHEMGGGIESTSGPVVERAGRPGGPAHQPGPPGRPVHRRSPPPAHGGGGNPLPGHGGLPAWT